MSKNTFFEELCYAPDRETDAYFEALDTIYNEEVKMIDLGVDSEVRMYLEAEDVEKDKLDAKAKKVAEYIKKAIDFIVQKLKEFWVYLKHKVQQFIRKIKFDTTRIKSLASSDKKFTVADLPYLEKTTIKFEKEMIPAMRKIISDYQSGKLTRNNLDKVKEQIKNGKDKINKISSEKQVTIGASALASLAIKYFAWLKNDQYEMNIENEFQSLRRLLDHVHPNYKEDGDTTPSDVADTLKTASSAVKNNRSKLVVTVVGVLGTAAAAVGGAVVAPKIAEEVYYRKTHKNS